MEEGLNTIQKISIALISIIDAGSIFRIAHCAIALQMADDGKQLKKRMRNIIIFMIIANCIFGFEFIKSYYK